MSDLQHTQQGEILGRKHRFPPDWFAPAWRSTRFRDGMPRQARARSQSLAE